MISISAKHRPATPGAHDTVLVFVGPDADHRALTGALIMSPDEAAAFCAAVNGIVQAAPQLAEPAVSPLAAAQARYDRAILARRAASLEADQAHEALYDAEVDARAGRT